MMCPSLTLEAARARQLFRSVQTHGSDIRATGVLATAASPDIGQHRIRRVSRCARVQRRPRRIENADGPEYAGRIRQPQFPRAFDAPANITSTVTRKAGDPVNDDVVLPVLGLAVV